MQMAEAARMSGAVNGALWGDRAADWARLQECQCRAVYEAVFARLNLGAGAAYLDAGCGAGLAAEMAAARGARVHGCDASEALLAIARNRVAAGVFKQSDLERLPFADGSFDAVTGFNSFQYAADPGRALAEARRVAKPGAAVVIVTWGRPEGMPAASLVAALRPLLPPPPPGAPGPYALSDEAALRACAAGAGLVPEVVFDVECAWSYAGLESAVRGLGSSGAAAKARQHTSAEAVDQAHRQALTSFRRQDGTYRIAAAFRCLFARTAHP
jgi:SAM-dependent methyltransferase